MEILIYPSVNNGIVEIANFKFILKGEKYEKEIPVMFAVGYMYRKYYIMCIIW